MILELLYFIPLVITIGGVTYLRHKNGAQSFSRADVLMICLAGLVPLINLVTAIGVIIDVLEPHKDWWNS